MAENGKAAIDIPTETKSKKKPSGFPAAYINICNTIIGAGTLGLPLAFSRAGLVPAILMLFALCALSQLGAYYLIHCADATTTYSYAELSGRLFGPVGTLVASISIFLTCFGFMWAYVILSTDFSVQVLQGWGVPATSVFCTRWFMTPVWGILFFMPMSWFRRVEALKYASFGGFFGIIYTVIAVAIRYFSPLAEVVKNTPEAFHASLSVIQTFSTMCFAFGCHPSITTILGELKKKSSRLMNGVVVSGFSSVSIVYLLCGVFGYLAQTNILIEHENGGNILSLYPLNDYVMMAARLTTLICVATSYPLQNIPARQALLASIRVIYDLAKKPKHIKTADLYPTNEIPPLIPKHYKQIVICGSLTKHHLMTGITSTIIAVTLTIMSLFLNKVALVFDIMGSTAGAMVSFILPAVFYIRMKLHPTRFVNPNRKAIIAPDEMENAFDGGETIEETDNPEAEADPNAPKKPKRNADALPSAVRPMHQVAPGTDMDDIPSRSGGISANDPRANSRMGLLAAQSPAATGFVSPLEMVEEEATGSTEMEVYPPGEEPIEPQNSRAAPLDDIEPNVPKQDILQSYFNLPLDPASDDEYQKRMRHLLVPVKKSNWRIISAAALCIGGIVFGSVSLAMAIIFNTNLKQYVEKYRVSQK